MTSALFPLMAPPVLAFGFASPWLLWGLMAAGLPILIHLLNRRKFRETQWAAMKFLLEAVRKNARRLQIEQLILLAMRVLALILFALALARPYLEEMGTYFQADQPAHKVLVIDGSLSMGLAQQETTLFDQAREAARTIVESATQGDAFNLVQISELPRPAITNPAYKPSDVTAVLDELKLSHGRGDLLGALRRVSDLLKLSGTPTQKEIYFLSDFQRATWAGNTAEEGEEIRRLLTELDDAGELILVDLGQSGAENLAVTDIASLSTFVTASEPARFKVTVRNFGSMRAENVGLSLSVAGRITERKRISLDAGSEVTEIFTQSFPADGEYAVAAQLQADSLTVDDTRWLSVPARDRLRVLCVNGRSAGRALGKATDYLALALAPGPMASAGKGLFDPVVINAGELQTQDLNRYDCVVVCDVSVITPQEARVFESYVQAGGGVVWCVGGRVQPETWNQALYRDGQGVLPARLGARRGDVVNKREVFEFDPGDYRHPIVNPFEGNPDAGLTTTQTFAYLESEPNTAKGARVALRFDSGAPAIVELPFGQGRSVLVTTSVDDTWSSWPLFPSFVPMVREMVLHASAGRATQRQQLVGTPLSLTIGGSLLSRDLAVARPDGDAVVVSLTGGAGFSQFAYENTDLSGMYEARLPPPLLRPELFAVNVDNRESDLTKLEQDELRSEVLSGVEFEYTTQWQGRTPTAPAKGPTVQRGGVSRLLLYAALFVLFVEALMAWDFRKGAALFAVGLLAVWLAVSVPWSLSTQPWLLVPAIGLPLLAIGFGIRRWRPW